MVVGSYGYDPVVELPGLEGSHAGALGLGIFPEPSRTLGIDLELMSVSRSYPNDFSSFLGSVDDETTLVTSMVRLGARLRLPPGWPVRPYVAAGFGFVHHDMEVRGSFIGLPGSFGKQQSRDWTPYVGFGVDARFGAWGGSVDHRAFQSTGSFGDPFAVSEVDLGGSSWYLGVAWYPGQGR